MNIFKKARLRSKLTLDDLRFVLNQKNWSSLSRVEAGKRLASKEMAIGYHVLFGIPFEAMFQKEIDEVKLFAEDYAASRIEDVQAKALGIDQVERVLALKQIQEHVAN